MRKRFFVYKLQISCCKLQAMTLPELQLSIAMKGGVWFGKCSKWVYYCLIWKYWKFDGHIPISFWAMMIFLWILPLEMSQISGSAGLWSRNLDDFLRGMLDKNPYSSQTNRNMITKLSIFSNETIIKSFWAFAESYPPLIPPVNLFENPHFFRGF